MAKLKPLSDRVIVERSEAEEKSAGGIVLPDTAKEKQKQGIVVAVGPGKTLDDGKVVSLEVKEGDKVIFGAYGGTEVKAEGKEYLILSESEILAVLPG